MTSEEARDGSPIARVEALLREWDPIGVRPGVDAPANEYDSNAPTIVAMVTAGASSGELAEHLGKLSAVRMGLWARPAWDLEIAGAIVAALELPPTPWPPSLHDASLVSICLDWITGEAVLRFRVAAAAEAVVLVREVSELVVPRREEGEVHHVKG